MLRGCKIITLLQLEQLLNRGQKVELVEQVEKFVADSNTDYVSYQGRQPITIKTTTKLYLLEMSNGEAYAVLSDYQPLHRLLYFW